MKSAALKALAYASSLLILSGVGSAQESLPFPPKASGSKAGPTHPLTTIARTPGGDAPSKSPHSPRSSLRRGSATKA